MDVRARRESLRYSHAECRQIAARVSDAKIGALMLRVIDQLIGDSLSGNRKCYCTDCITLYFVAQSDPMSSDEIVTAIKSAILDLNSEIYGGYDIDPSHAEERASNIATWVIAEIEEAKMK